MRCYRRVVSSSITRKILALIVFSMGISFLVSILIMRKVQESYFHYVYETKTDMLNHSMSGIEEKLSGYETATYQFVTGSRTQQFVSRFLAACDQFDNAKEEDGLNWINERRSARGIKAVNIIKIIRELDTCLSRTDKADTGYFIDRENNQYSGYGSSRISVSEEDLLKIADEAKKRKGGAVYQVVNVRYGSGGESRKEVAIARSILEKQNMTMRYCGTVIFLVNPEMLASSYLTETNGLLILEGDNPGVVFSTVNPEEEEVFRTKIKNDGNEKYEIVRLEGKRYFVTSIKSENLDWRYYNCLLYTSPSPRDCS